MSYCDDLCGYDKCYVDGTASGVDTLVCFGGMLIMRYWFKCDRKDEEVDY